jgi:hypothetical protein
MVIGNLLMLVKKHIRDYSVNHIKARYKPVKTELH